MNRRELIQALLGGAAAALVSSGCGRSRLPPKGQLLAPDLAIGHRIRDGFLPQPTATAWQDVTVAIVGGGIAGLTAAWRLAREGIDDFVVFELNANAGGTAAFGDDGVTRYPWAAHYLPVPMPENRALLQLLEEMETIEGYDAQGNAVVREQYLCRDPAERLFIGDTWTEGLYPSLHASAEDLRQREAFRQEVDRWVERRDIQGRRLFAIPLAMGSDDPEVVALDRVSMAAWMDQHGWTSTRLRWMVDYACRDDYGLRLDQTSAWAGVFYFASRLRGAGATSQPIITWPEGNGRFVRHFLQRVGDRTKLSHAVCRITPPVHRSGDATTKLIVWDVAKQQALGVRADHVIFAAPQFLKRHLIEGASSPPNAAHVAFEYGGWIVANLHLDGRLRDNGFPLSWDNVIYESPSLGYVVATHQLGIDHGPTILTWYYPLVNAEPAMARKELLRLSWADWADVVLTDLERAHPDIRALTVRLDVMRWGHAMVQPRPGFVWSQARRQAATPDRSIHFACTDLSGIALIEEAFYHGVRAAEEVMLVRHDAFTSMR